VTDLSTAMLTSGIAPLALSIFWLARRLRNRR
jgi:hypothetical protein